MDPFTICLPSLSLISTESNESNLSEYANCPCRESKEILSKCPLYTDASPRALGLSDVPSIAIDKDAVPDISIPAKSENDEISTPDVLTSRFTLSSPQSPFTENVPSSIVPFK